MNVLIFINYQDKEYSWNELTKEQQKEIKNKLNKQTADKLGYS